MGSDFTYSDIAGRKLNQDNHQLIKETERHFRIKSTPKDISTSIYSKILYVVSKKYNVILKAIFFDLEGKKIKNINQFKNINY